MLGVSLTKFSVCASLSVYGRCFTSKILCEFLSLWWVSYLRNFLSLCKVTNFCLCLSLSVIRILSMRFFFLFLPHFVAAVLLFKCVWLFLYGSCLRYEIFRALSVFMVGIYKRNFVPLSPSLHDGCFTYEIVCFSLCEWWVLYVQNSCFSLCKCTGFYKRVFVSVSLSVMWLFHISSFVCVSLSEWWVYNILCTSLSVWWVFYL